MLLIRFVHFLGMALWIGGMVAAMVLSVSARSATGAERNAAFRWAGRLYSLVVGPGALLTVVTGLVLTMSLAQQAGSQVMAQPSIWVMQVAGLVAGVLVLFLALPTSTPMPRMAHAAPAGRAVRATLRGTGEGGDLTEARVGSREFRGNPPFGGDDYSHDELFALRQEGGEWRIVEPPWPVHFCPEPPVRVPPAGS